MLIIIGFVIICVVLNILFLVLTLKDKDDNVYFLFNLFLFVLCFPVFGPYLDGNEQEKKFSATYAETQYKISTYDPTKDINSVQLYEILKSVNEINDIIEKNKEYCNSMWIGAYYSEIIANYQPIVLNVEDVNLKIENNE